ncbi:hypothetical protein CDG76_19830 [Nostoc sp. 'Peltigera membranacea cyanobiont' 210A]|nr:hypothetical protein CDG76_19830 [Nostoc sp. 'Peltigera membranacea cyanobiont' 210A]
MIFTDLYRRHWRIEEGFIRVNYYTSAMFTTSHSYAIYIATQFKIQNSKFKIKDIFKRGFKPRLKLALPVEVGVLNPLIYDNCFLSKVGSKRLLYVYLI